jgi:diguanylate cyclase (GGDEF)-like protein
MKVLIADDDPISLKVLSTLLTTWGYTVQVAKDGEQAMALLIAPDAPQLAILDWMMPGKNGLELVEMLRSLGSQHYTYVLMLTSRTQKEDVESALYGGCDDYLAKPFDPVELKARLFVGQRILSLQQQTQYQATHDALTGAWNRGSVMEALTREIARSRRSFEPLSAMMLDLDKFKDINDTYGHEAGDIVLKEFTARTMRCLRDYDFFGRYGGEEFLAILTNCAAAEAIRAAERIRQAVSGTPMRVMGSEIKLTVSIGVSQFRAADLVEELVRRADQALYAAKRAGRNCVQADEGAAAVLAARSSQ